MNKILDSAIIFLKGGFIGIGNIIPGVSGATIALLLGIYQRLIKAINSIDVNMVKTILGLSSSEKVIEKACKQNLNAWMPFFWEYWALGHCWLYIYFLIQ